ncbi:MAG: putative acetyltransferase [Paraglaciecola sp.]|jgi:putative acetyltransferase
MKKEITSTDFTFRLIEEKDNPTVAMLIRTVMTEFGTVGEGYSIMDREVDEMWENYTNEQSCFLVLILKDKVVGCGGIGLLKGGDAKTCELKKMYFYPEARGFGLGQKLVKKCLKKAKAIGYQTCYLETVARMTQANELYEKMGFQLLEQPMGCTGHSACDRQMARVI